MSCGSFTDRLFLSKDRAGDKHSSPFPRNFLLRTLSPLGVSPVRVGYGHLHLVWNFVVALTVLF